MLPTFTLRDQPLQESCIDHLTLCDPHRISRQMEDTVIVRTAFLDHHGILGTLHLRILTKEALTPPFPRLPRVPNSIPIPDTGTHS
jgi:hypothetical protein